MNDRQNYLDSAWVDLNTSLINAEIRAARRKRVTCAIGWVVSIIVAAAIASLIFWGAIAAAQDAATATQQIMRF